MYKYILLPALSLALLNEGMAQSGFKLGLKGGLNVTTMTGNDVTWLEREEGFVRQPKLRPGAHVGPTFNLGFGRHGNASLTFDVLFSMKGSNYYYDQYYYENDDDTVTTKLEVKESVTRLGVDVPILFRYRTDFGLYGEAGLFLSIMPVTLFKTDDPRYVEASTTEFDYVDIEEGLYRPFDFGFNVGAGWISKGGFGIGLRGFMGMLDQYETYGFVGLITPSGRTVNVGAQLSLMYHFGWDSKRRR